MSDQASKIVFCSRQPETNISVHPVYAYYKFSEVLFPTCATAPCTNTHCWKVAAWDILSEAQRFLCLSSFTTTGFPSKRTNLLTCPHEIKALCRTISRWRHWHRLFATARFPPSAASLLPRTTLPHIQHLCLLVTTPSCNHHTSTLPLFP